MRSTLKLLTGLIFLFRKRDNDSRRADGESGGVEDLDPNANIQSRIYDMEDKLEANAVKIYNLESEIRHLHEIRGMHKLQLAKC